MYKCKCGLLADTHNEQDTYAAPIPDGCVCSPHASLPPPPNVSLQFTDTELGCASQGQDEGGACF